MSDLEAQMAADKRREAAERAEAEARFQRELAEAKRILDQNGGPNG